MRIGAGSQLKPTASLAGLTMHNLESANATANTLNQSYSMNGKIVISALAVLFFIFIVILLLHVYAKWLRWRSPTISRLLNRSFFPQDPPCPGIALDRRIVEALPIFMYGLPYLSCKAVNASEAVQCAVCLSDFRQDETCKLLPKCKHFFHVECIDMWFLSNTTCPLCRTAADPHLQHGEARGVGASMSYCFTKQDGGIELAGEHVQRPVIDAPEGIRS